MTGKAPALLPLLTPEECDRTLERVLANRERWTARHPGLPFYTFGAASYLDAENDPDLYYRRAAALNPVLEREFGWLHDRVLEALSGHLDAPATFEPRAGRPGFHVFLAHEAFKRPLGRIHFDLQYEGLEWDGARDFSRPVSFTLAVKLPHAGAGLQTWDIAKADYDALAPDERERFRLDAEPDYVAYRAGAMLCHSGLLLHRIAPVQEDMRPNDMRVTLQGHALPGADGYRVYW